MFHCLLLQLLSHFFADYALLNVVMYYLYTYAPSIIQLQMDLDQLKFIVYVYKRIC